MPQFGKTQQVSLSQPLDLQRVSADMGSQPSLHLKLFFQVPFTAQPFSFFVMCQLPFCNFCHLPFGICLNANLHLHNWFSQHMSDVHPPAGQSFASFTYWPRPHRPLKPVLHVVRSQHVSRVHPSSSQ
jgi:hypothetical protein